MSDWDQCQADDQCDRKVYWGIEHSSSVGGSGRSHSCSGHLSEAISALIGEHGRCMPGGGSARVWIRL